MRDIDQWVRTGGTDAIAKRWPARSQREVRHSTRFRRRLARYAVGIPMMAAAFLAGACEPETIEPGWKLHPTERNAPPADAIALTDDSVPPGLVGDRLERWRGAREQLIRARVVANIGSENEGPDLLGQVRGAEVDQEGSLVVLDGQALTIGFFGPDGAYLHGFERGHDSLRQPAPRSDGHRPRHVVGPCRPAIQTPWGEVGPGGRAHLPSGPRDGSRILDQ